MLLKKLPASLAIGALLAVIGCAGPTESSNSKPTSDGGTAVWARSATAAPSTTRFLAMTKDGAGNVYVLGQLWGDGEFSFGPGVTITGGYEYGFTCYVVKYDASGAAQWATAPATGGEGMVLNGLTVDGSGNLYVAGSILYEFTYDFGNGVTVTGTHSNDTALLLKYNSSGEAQWAKTPTSNAQDIFYGVTADGDGNIYVAGVLSGVGTTHDFDFGVTVDNELWNGTSVLVKYNSSGETEWARTATGTGEEPGAGFNGLKVGTDGVYAVGWLGAAGTYDFGNEVTAEPSSVAGSPVIVKYSTSGTAQWARTATSTSEGTNGLFNQIAIDGSGNVFAVGVIVGTATYDFGVSVAGSGNRSNAVLVKYNASGTAQWARSVSSGTAYNEFLGVAVDGAGNVYTSGDMTGTSRYEFGNGVSVTGSSTDDNFLLVKYDTSGKARWAKTVSGVTSSGGTQVAVGNNGKLYAAGYFNGTTVDVGGATVTGPFDINALLVQYQ